FVTADRRVGTQMKATGEVMAIGRTFEAALLKAVRSLEIGIYGLRARNINTWSDMQIEEALRHATDERLFAVAEAFRRGWVIREVQELTDIDPWFLHKIRDLVAMEERIKADGANAGEVLRAEAKQMGFSDRTIAELWGVPEEEVREARRRSALRPAYKMVDTCAAEFDAETPYFYSTYEPGAEDEAAPQTSDVRLKTSEETGDPPYLTSDGLRLTSAKRKKALVIGSGPIRIGQGIEFDYCSVHSVWALREAGYESIIVNNNPETVSTDFDTSNRLYFEPLTAEDVLAIIEEEQPEGVIVQFGGQTAINLAQPLHEAGVRILGSSFESIDVSEDRDKFEQLLRGLGIPKPPGRAVRSIEAALEVAEEIGFPVLV